MQFLKLKWLLISLVILGIFWIGWKELKSQGADLLPVKQIKIEGVFQHVAKDKIQQILLKHVMTGFLNVDVNAIHLDLHDLPWVSTVNIQRVWLDTLQVTMTEQYPVVQWNNQGLLNEHGDLFIPNNLTSFKHLPLLIGPEGLEKKLMRIMWRLRRDLTAKSLILHEFKVDERRAWSLKLTNGLVLKLGQKKPFDKFNRFLTTFDQFKKKHTRRAIAKIDLRYANGYAVTWK